MRLRCPCLALYNPHARLRLHGTTLLEPVPLKKWNACQRTSAHWYAQAQLADLVAALLNGNAPARTRRGRSASW